MKFSSIPPENLQILGGIDDFLPDSAYIFCWLQKQRCAITAHLWGIF